MGAVHGGRIGTARVLFDFSRGRQALLSVAQPALGALLALQGPPSLRLLGLGVPAAAAGYLAVFSLNDLLDRDVDRESLALEPPPGDVSPGAPAGPRRNAARKDYDLDVAFLRHPLARGDLSLTMGVLWVCGLALVSFLLAYALRPLCGLLFMVCVGLEVLYCGLKRTTWLKTVPAGVMVGLGGVVGWLAAGPWAKGAFAVGVLLFCWEVFGRNLSNDLADLSTDRPVGIVTLATVHGRGTAARVIVAGCLAMPAVALLQAGGPFLRVLLAAMALWSMTLPALRLRRRPVESEAQRFFNRASFFPVLACVAAAAALLA